MTLLADSGLAFRAGTSSRPLRYLAPTTFVTDVLLVTVTGALAALGRDRLPGFAPAPFNVGDTLGVAWPLIMGGWLMAIWLSGGYSKDVFGAGTDEYKRVLNASVMAAGLVGVCAYLAKFQLSRGFFLLLFVLGVPALLIGRVVLRRALYRARSRGALMQRVVIAGTPSHVDEVAHVLRRESWLGYQVVGALVPQGGVETTTGVPVLGTPEQMLAAIETTDADVIFLAGGALDSSAQLRRLAWDLEDRDVQVVVAPSVTDVSAERVRVRPVGGLPLMHLDKPRAIRASRFGKRAFDLVGSTLLLLLFMPLFLLIALAVKLHDGGPVLFGQVRTGRDGTTFRCLKFRSMAVDAEARLAELYAQTGYALEAGLFKMEDDPRITRPGHWLRRFSLDELPQLVNVLRGEMSLVGPRPPLPAEVAVYHIDTTRRLRVRPGMTGLWQVSGRADLSFDEAIRLDLYYVDNWSMLQDLAILGRTLGAVVGSRGAY